MKTSAYGPYCSRDRGRKITWDQNSKWNLGKKQGSVQELFPVAPILRGWGRRTVKRLMPAWAIANPYIIVIVVVIIIVTYILNLLHLFTCACIHMSTYMFHGPRVKVLPPCGFPRDWSSCQIWQQAPLTTKPSCWPYILCIFKMHKESL